MRDAISILLAVLVAAQPVWADGRTLRWSELFNFIADRSIALTLPDGAKIEGRTVSVEPETLTIDVRKTSDPAAHARGHQSIPKAQVHSLVVSRPTVRWRIIGATVGGLAGVPLGVLTVIEKNGLFSKGNDNGIIAGVIAGMAAAGFFIGWAADRRKTTVMIVGDTSAE